MNIACRPFTAERHPRAGIRAGIDNHFINAERHNQKKTKMKKLLMMIGAAAVAVGACADTVTTNGIAWTFQPGSALSDGTTAATLGNGTSACIATSTAVDAANIPWTFTKDGIDYTVTQIAAHAFDNCSKLSGTLTIPDAVTGLVGDYAFSGCSQLTRLASLGGITEIGNRSFDKCTGLDDTECPDMSKVTAIDVYNSLHFGGEVWLVSLNKGRGIGDNAFMGATITNAVLSRKAVDISGNRIFKDCTRLESMFIPGPDSGSERTLVRRSEFVSGCTSLKVFLAGPLTGLSSIWGRTDVNMFSGVSGCHIFVPTGSNWDTETASDKGLAAYEADNTIFYYGAGRDLDMAFDHNAHLITATPTTAHALTNILNAASTFKNRFGYDTRINMTNAIEVAEGTITDATIAGMAFESLIFNVKTQAQLDMVMDATASVTTPLCIDPTGAKQQMTVPANRRVWVLLSGDGKYTPKINGLTITFY